jgi:hypothetical protein
MASTVLIITNDHDEHASAVIDELHKRDVPVLRFHPEEFPDASGISIEIQPDGRVEGEIRNAHHRAEFLDVFLLVLVPLTIVETRYHARIIDLQTTSAPELFRMTHLTQKSIDATWQRDIRVYGSTILQDEYRVLAQRYVSNLKRLLRRYQLIRIVVGLGAAAITTCAMGVVFWHITTSPTGLAEAAILLPALVLGLIQGRAFSFSWGTLSECLGYLAQVFEFLNQSFEEPARAAPRPAMLPRARSAAA